MVDMDVDFRISQIASPMTMSPGNIRIGSPESKVAIDPRYPSRFGNCVKQVKGIINPVARKIERLSIATQAIKTPKTKARILRIERPIIDTSEICAAFIPLVNGFKRKP